MVDRGVGRRVDRPGGQRPSWTTAHADAASRAASSGAIVINAPGPFAVRDDMPFRPRPDYAAWLGAILQPVIDTLGASDAVLVPAQHTIGSNTGAGFEAAYASTVGVADATLQTHANDGNDPTAFILDDHGNFTTALGNQVAPYLPPVDSPIPGDFSAPPGPPQPTQPPQDEPQDGGNI